MTGQDAGTRCDITEALAWWITGFRLDDAPTRAIEEARKCLLDGIGVAVAASGLEVSRNAAAAAAKLYGPGPCTTVIGSNAGVSAPGAALVNGTAGHALDFDDTSYTGIFHATAVCWPATLAAAEQENSTGEEMLSAFIAGVETCYALAEWLGTSIYFDGWWTTSLIGQPGAAAAVARILNLGERETAAALGLAIANAAGMRAVLGSAAKPVGVGIAARQGLEAAVLAAAGIGAGDRIATGEHGWLDQLAPQNLDPGRIDLIGQRFGLIDPGILFKRYPICSAAHAATDAASEIADDLAPETSAIETVECVVTPLVATSLKYPAPETPEQAQFSLPFAVATALTDRTVSPEHLARHHWTVPAIRELMAKVVMTPSADLDGTLGRSEDGPEGAIVTVRMCDGRTFTVAKPIAYGMPENPMSLNDLSGKFMACCEPDLGPECSRQLQERLLALETLPSAATLFDGVLKDKT